MKSLLVCPGPRPAVAQLAENTPLALVPLLGENLLAYWLVHLASLGAKEVTVLACDRPSAIWQAVGDGARWGLRVHVVAELRELSADEAKQRHGVGDGWLPSPNDAILIDHLPGLPQHKLLESYSAWFAAARAWIDRAHTPDRVGVREIRPGVHVGWQTRIPDDAVIIPPVWIGEKVSIGSGVTLGPCAIIEDRAIIEPGAEIVRSVVGPETLVGEQTEIGDSIAVGDTLISWQMNSWVRVPDEFLLCPLRQPIREPATEGADWLRRMARSITGSAPPMLPQERMAASLPPSAVGLPPF